MELIYLRYAADIINADAFCAGHAAGVSRCINKVLTGKRRASWFRISWIHFTNLIPNTSSTGFFSPSSIIKNGAGDINACLKFTGHCLTARLAA